MLQPKSQPVIQYIETHPVECSIFITMKIGLLACPEIQWYGNTKIQTSIPSESRDSAVSSQLLYCTIQALHTSRLSSVNLNMKRCYDATKWNWMFI